LYPDNGSGYLYMPDGIVGGVTFGPTNFFTASHPFGLVSLDAAEFVSGAGSSSLTFIGYVPMGGTVTNTFTLDGINDGSGPLQDFQTLHFDSSFSDVFRIDVLNARWAVDNVVIGPIPEPSASTLILLGGLSAAGWARFKKERVSRATKGRSWLNYPIR
jgi:hypothetical protein